MLSPEERAQALIGDMPWVTRHLLAGELADLPKQFAAAIRAAVAEEREACAKFVENFKISQPDYNSITEAGQIVAYWCERIAAAIRARSKDALHRYPSPAGS